MTHTDAAWTRLGNAIKDRRADLGWSQRALAEKAVISVNRVQMLEYGQVRSPRPITILGLETILGWAHGSVDTVLRGGEPTLTEPAQITDAARRPTDEQRQVAELLLNVRRLHGAKTFATALEILRQAEPDVTEPRPVAHPE